MTINLTDPANQLTEELQLTPERLADIAEDGYIVDGEAQEMARRLLAAEVELLERRKSDAPPAPKTSKMSGIMPDYEGVAMTQRECYMAGKEAGLAEARKSPVIPDCWCRICRPVTITDMRFVVCPNCGNKRCPHANDHRNACTGSNDPGQEGSAYPAAPQEVKS